MLDAAARIAGERGYEGTTINRVTERSGLPASSIYCARRPARFATFPRRIGLALGTLVSADLPALHAEQSTASSPFVLQHPTPAMARMMHSGRSAGSAR